ncbi:hypothetical protein ON010_g17895 [Phytophthora cinnamomi]|nr:hypothetical protein ON010_g17895 [Phytophthora cinnamomi]
MEEGVSRNWFVFVRSWVLTGVIGAGVLVQIGQGVTQLKMTTRQVTFISLLAATISIAFVALLCSLIVFPLPFGTLVAGPPCVFVIGAGVIHISKPRLQADPSLWKELKRQLDVFHCQTALTFIYPLYIYGYVSLTGLNQAAFVLVSPVIQIIAKNWISRKLTHHDYMKPETVVFSVELFNALYSSSVLQGASSWKTIVIIMGTDIVQFGLAMFDMMKLLDEVKLLMRRIPREHPLSKENFVQIAERLVNVEAKERSPQPKVNYPSNSTASWRKHIKVWVKFTNNSNTGSATPREATMQLNNDPFTGRNRSSKWIISHKARVFPIRPPQWTRRNFQTHIGEYSDIAAVEAASTDELSLGIEVIFSRKERALFIQKTSQVLFVTEYVMLGEYLEVAMPIIFSK